MCTHHLTSRRRLLCDTPVSTWRMSISVGCLKGVAFHHLRASVPASGLGRGRDHPDSALTLLHPLPQRGLGQGQPPRSRVCGTVSRRMLSLPASPVTCVPSGLDHFLYGLSDELKQAHREQLFAVHREGLIDVSNK